MCAECSLWKNMTLDTDTVSLMAPIKETCCLCILAVARRHCELTRIMLRSCPFACRFELLPCQSARSRSQSVSLVWGGLKLMWGPLSDGLWRWCRFLSRWYCWLRWKINIAALRCWSVSWSCKKRKRFDKRCSWIALSLNIDTKKCLYSGFK